MGSSQSILSTSEITDAPFNVSNVKEYAASTKNGTKTKSMDQTNLMISVTTEEEPITDSNASVVSSESDYSSDEEDDEEMAERRMILEEAHQLLEMAEFYFHPEAPVASDATACARCFFSRYSAPTSDSEELEDEVERELVLADAKNLKELAVWYMHPEKPIAVDSTACGRNYFSRPSASVNEEEEERELILEEMKQLKATAEWYMHPEAPVVSDATACGRNFFTRPSAAVNEEEEEREHILEEMKQLTTIAEWYMHPEKPVTVDANVCGRNYFTRPSAPEGEEDGMEEERELIMEDMKALTMIAVWYMHPEKPVTVDSAACGRNYFSRPSVFDDAECVSWVDSSGEQRLSLDFESNYSEEMEEERKLVLAESNQLKEIASWYLQPGKPVTVVSTACGRNYFSRPSALDDAECVSWVDSSGEQRLSLDFESNYSEEMEEERKLVLAEANQLKEIASWYLQPERPVTVVSTACGRNYFSRPSVLDDAECVSWVDSSGVQRLSLDFESNYSEEMEDECKLVLAEANQLKEMASWYLQPEKPVTVDSTACGRNYFSRPSAPEHDDAGCLSWVDPSEGQHLSLDFESNYTEEMEKEYKLVLAEANQLKEIASWYLQPEKPIAVNFTACGRNYFSRPSAPEQEDLDDIEERDLILAEVNELKMVANWYRNPETEVTVYATAVGRNYFTRPSAPMEDDSDAEEREDILADAAELLKVAKWYMHPETPVTVYVTACGRNFFSRPSAPQVEDDEMEEERLLILAEVEQLKEVAGWYFNPDQPVKSDGFATARNYFTRPSAPEYEEDTKERDQVLAEAKELKEVAGWYLNPEQPVKSDGFATARSYFTRPSAPEQEEEDNEELKQILAEANELKAVASWYLEPEKPVAVDSTAFGRNYFTRPSAEQATEEDEEEIASILADAMELKKLAVDYLHPEKPVVSSSVNCARNFFDRPSAPVHADHIHSEGYSNHPTIHADYVHEGYDYSHADYDHDHHHHDDISQQSFQSHGDHFEMDEDVCHGFRDSFSAFHNSVVGTHDPHHIPIIKEEDDGKEGNLSRSPSSIMLFDEQAAV